MFTRRCTSTKCLIVQLGFHWNLSQWEISWTYSTASLSWTNTLTTMSSLSRNALNLTDKNTSSSILEWDYYACITATFSGRFQEDFSNLRKGTELTIKADIIEWFINLTVSFHQFMFFKSLTEYTVLHCVIILRICHSVSMWTFRVHDKVIQSLNMPVIALKVDKIL